jgi:uncharacterized membrane protein YbhN (UPF0104 family)
MKRATWSTSALGGAIFGVTTALCAGKAGPAIVSLQTIAFFGTLFIGVLGFAQWQELESEHERRNIPSWSILTGPGDFERFYRPVMLRAFVWALANFSAYFLMGLVLA